MKPSTKLIIFDPLFSEVTGINIHYSAICNSINGRHRGSITSVCICRPVRKGADSSLSNFTAITQTISCEPKHQRTDADMVPGLIIGAVHR